MATEGGWCEFDDPMEAAYVVGTSGRGYRRGWHVNRRVVQPYGAKVFCKAGEYIAVRWDEDWSVPFDLYHCPKDGQLTHVETVQGDMRAAVEAHRGIPATKSLPMLSEGFTTLPPGTAFAESLDVFRIKSHGRKRVQYYEISWSDLTPGETLHVPSCGDWHDVMSARPIGACESDPIRGGLSEYSRARIPAGVIVLEYPSRNA